jgi:hypothetical protein
MIGALLLAEHLALVDRDGHQFVLGNPILRVLVKEGDDVRIAVEALNARLALVERLLTIVQIPRLAETRLILRRQPLELPLTHLLGDLVKAGVGLLQLLVDGGHRLVLTGLLRAELLLVRFRQLPLELGLEPLVLLVGEVGFLFSWRSLGFCPRRLLPLRGYLRRGLLVLSGLPRSLGCGRLCR